jgi:hypothetical protein
MVGPTLLAVAVAVAVPFFEVNVTCLFLNVDDGTLRRLMNPQGLLL